MNRFAGCIVLSCVLAPAAPGAAGLPVFLEHNIRVSVEPSTQTAVIEDSGRISCQAGSNLVCLRSGASVELFTLNGEPAAYKLVADGDTTKLSDDLRAQLASLGLDRQAAFLLFERAARDTLGFHLKYSAVFNDPVEEVQFSREKVGSEVAGTILDLGAYLSPASCYYPRGADGLASYSLTADIPVAWEAISDGNPMASETRGDRKIQRFANPLPAEGCVFMAAPYVVKSTSVDGITVATYFFAEDTSLCDKYLTATADYLRMYQQLIGPYPFTQFTVADNFFPTGYGMPGWTLLGQAVLRLPFIITSSLGHEVLHSWWGNAVYPMYERGNWSEPITVYGADYRYKLLSSPEAARDYRKDILKEYLSYVTEGNDFPLREFTSRSSPETRTIGYNKGMMVFHLIEQEIGTEAFFEAWKLVYRAHRGQAISWEEFLAAFQQTGQRNLRHIIPEWIERAGAPELGLEVLAVHPGVGGGRMVSLKLTQSATTPYSLNVPLRAEGPGVADSLTVELTGAEAPVDFAVSPGVTTISVDPDFHIFRRLYPEEVEPIVSAVLGVTDKAIVSFSPDAKALEGFAAFGSALLEGSAKVLQAADLGSLPKNQVPVVLNPTPLPDYLYALVHTTPDSITLGGQTFPRAGHTAVLAGQDWDGFDRCLVVLSADYGSLPRIGQLVPHYGKYSYLVFAGAKNVAKGQWPVTESPLRVQLP